MIRLLLTFITIFSITIIIMPFVIMFAKKMKVKQTILSYVDNHQGKSGTPTMGGIGIAIALLFTLIYLKGEKTLAVLTLIVGLSYGVVGFLDDFIKVHYKQNQGLSSLQKIIFQVFIAIIVGVYSVKSSLIGDKLILPFTYMEISLGYFALPFYILIFLSFTNGVNLTDGLDGLASSVTFIFMLVMGCILAILVYVLGIPTFTLEENYNILVLVCGILGSILGFLCYNVYPAKIFMGDTGSLLLGGLVACFLIVSKLSLFAPIIGIMYVLTCLSDILQVIHYKRTKKRIFLMAPLHHHFERKGIAENRIVFAYSMITLFIGVVVIILTLNII